ncbi:MAG: hypothetical protein KAW12_06015 [Candidatus Aminicenantes bacterium]|nr:hypothetical protein [Candidatus Aminicenantes bacterium]
MENIVYLIALPILAVVLLLIYINRRHIKKLLRPASKQDIILGAGFTTHSPIVKLSFDESLNVDRFTGELRSYSLEHADKAFKEIYEIDKPGGEITRLIEGVKEKIEGNKLIWELSNEGKRLLKEKSIEWFKNKESGKFLPQLVGKKGKKIGELLKSYGSVDITKITRLANIAVNAANIVSGADQAKKLKTLSKQIDYLTAARRIDHLSKLESNFYLAKELLSNPLEPTKINKVLDLHREVIEMRTNWRNEIEHRLKNIDDPKTKSFLKKLFSTRKSRDKEVFSEISQFEEEIGLIDFSFIYDIALCESIGHVNSSLSTEINRLEETGNLLQKKANYLSGANEEYKIDNQIKQLDRIIRRYKRFRPVIQ